MSPHPKAPLGSQAESHSVRARLDDLARRYYAPLASFFRKRTRNAHEVQDLVQQVFLRLAQYRELGDIQNPDGYIFQTAANTLKDHHRRNAVRERFVNGQLASPDGADSDFSAERVLQDRETVTQVVSALRQLPERTRDILMLRCFEGLRHAEIARLQGISVRAVEKHMARALAHLNQVLERDNRE
ncbi:MAG: sigma-70 family RNA polymerase sigma factor [Gammaproteobacteria bacterium]